MFHKCQVSTYEALSLKPNEDDERIQRKVERAKRNMPYIEPGNYRYLLDHFTMKCEEDDLGVFIIVVRIKNKDYRFLLDTGAQISGILASSKLLEGLSQNQELTIKSAGGMDKKLSAVKIERMFLGGIEILDHTFITLELKDFKLPFMKESFLNFDGLIGWDILQRFDFEIDAKHHLFTVLGTFLESVETNRSNLVNLPFPSIIVHDMYKKSALFGIDTGAKVTWMNPLYARRRRYELTKNRPMMHIGVHGVETYSVPFVKKCRFTFDHTKIQLEQVRCMQTEILPHFSLDGIFGNEIFEGHTIQFLNSERRLCILE